MYSVNFQATARTPVYQFEEDLAAILTSASIGILGVNVFTSPSAEIPSGNPADTNAYIVILSTGGQASDHPQHTDDTSIEHLSAQIEIRHIDALTCRSVAYAVYYAIDNTRNALITNINA